jgi:predicted PurR-regulated permease PerM
VGLTSPAFETALLLIMLYFFLRDGCLAGLHRSTNFIPPWFLNGAASIHPLWSFLASSAA